MNEKDFTTDFSLKLSPQAPAIPCRLSLRVYGPAYLRIYYNDDQDYIQLQGEPGHVAAALHRLADIIAPGNFKERHEKSVRKELAELPAMLEQPETAWPWLVKRFPWLFDGIELSREPYASYLRSGNRSPDRSQKEPKLAA